VWKKSEKKSFNLFCYIVQNVVEIQNVVVIHFSYVEKALTSLVVCLILFILVAFFETVLAGVALTGAVSF